MKGIITIASLIVLASSVWGQQSNTKETTNLSKADPQAIGSLLEDWGYKKVENPTQPWNRIVTNGEAFFTWSIDSIPRTRQSSNRILWLHTVLDFKEPRTASQINKINAVRGLFAKCFLRIDGSVDISDYIDLRAGFDPQAVKDRVSQFAGMVAHPDKVFETPKQDVWNRSAGERPFPAREIDVDQVINGLSREEVDILIERLGWKDTKARLITGIPRIVFKVDGIELVISGYDLFPSLFPQGQRLKVSADIDGPEAWIKSEEWKRLEGDGITIFADSQSKVLFVQRSDDLSGGVRLGTFIDRIRDLAKRAKDVQKESTAYSQRKQTNEK